jgi:DNA-binding LacI/PurR family transcriptional regulator
MRKPSITTHDVARRAGVSQPTVSLVLSNNPRARVAESTRERVLEAARELGYRPNLLARGLVSRRSFALGVVVPDLDNPFFTEVVSGAERVAAESGYAMLLCDTRQTAAARHIESLRARLIDGVILDPGSASAVPAALLSGLNVVVVDATEGDLPGVSSDVEGTGRLAARHLLQLGHRRAGFIGPATDSRVFRLRERGYVRTLHEAGITIPSAWLRRVPATLAGGTSAMRELLRLRERPTAVFCGNDLAALGALKACHQAGVRVPEQMSVVGCDDIEMAVVVSPELTTVRVPARGLGARAARMLVGLIEERPRRAGAALPVELMIRGTTAAPAEPA